MLHTASLRLAAGLLAGPLLFTAETAPLASVVLGSARTVAA
jgi:hypothetical protein